MKVVTISRLSLVFALALGLLVAWTAATPDVIGTKAFIGGWVPTPAGDPCHGDHYEMCEDYPGCDWDGNEMLTCENEYGTCGRTCQPGELQPCTIGTDLCTSTWDGECRV